MHVNVLLWSNWHFGLDPRQHLFVSSVVTSSSLHRQLCPRFISIHMSDEAPDSEVQNTIFTINQEQESIATAYIEATALLRTQRHGSCQLDHSVSAILLYLIQENGKPLTSNIHQVLSLLSHDALSPVERLAESTNTTSRHTESCARAAHRLGAYWLGRLRVAFVQVRDGEEYRRLRSTTRTIA